MPLDLYHGNPVSGEAMSTHSNACWATPQEVKTFEVNNSPKLRKAISVLSHVVLEAVWKPENAPWFSADSHLQVGFWDKSSSSSFGARWGQFSSRFPQGHPFCKSGGDAFHCVKCKLEFLSIIELSQSEICDYTSQGLRRFSAPTRTSKVVLYGTIFELKTYCECLKG